MELYINKDMLHRLWKEDDGKNPKHRICYNNVKGVDLEKEIEEVKHNYKVDDNRHTSICSADIEWLANHFFELGLKAAQKGE